MAKVKKALGKKGHDWMNHRRQMWWLRHGVVMLPTLRDEIQMHREILKKKRAEANA